MSLRTRSVKYPEVFHKPLSLTEETTILKALKSALLRSLADHLPWDESAFINMTWKKAPLSERSGSYQYVATVDFELKSDMDAEVMEKKTPKKNSGLKEFFIRFFK